MRLFGEIFLKHYLKDLITEALKREKIPLTEIKSVKIEKTRDNQHGNFSTNIALVIAKSIKIKPRDLADRIARSIPESEYIDHIEVAGPGFINFFLCDNAFLSTIDNILENGKKYGRSEFGNGDRILIEFVSANPTGPLHVGHGRGAAYGAAIGNLLEAIGYDIDKEYYVNDAGRQMDILTISIWLRYLEICKVNIFFPEQAYQGNYIREIAQTIFEDIGDVSNSDIKSQIDEISSSHDAEQYLDDLISMAKFELGEEKYELFFTQGLDRILNEIRTDLEKFGITYDNWYSERSLAGDNQIDNCINYMRDNGKTYEKDGALWFRSSEFGDEKDRVIIRENGQTTYFASDIAYHKSKFDRGYNKIINIWGADHHGYIDRIKAALKALDKDPDALKILLVQFVSLYRGKEKVQMSTRSGQYVTLHELREEVGRDAARFFYILRKSEQHLDFDLELAVSHSNDNPVYYIQYAHSRICSVVKQLHEKGYKFTPGVTKGNLDLLIEPQEQALLARLTQYPETVHNAAITFEPHQIAYYLRDLANDFHTYYNACQFLVENEVLRNARTTLICAVQQVIQNGLDLLGVSAPESM